MNNITTSLKPFQKDTIKWMYTQENNHSSGLIFNEAGTGKTLCCISLISQKRSTHPKTLILCPAGLVLNWENEILKHSNFLPQDIFKYTGPTRKQSLQNIHNPTFYISSYSLVSREYLDKNNHNKDNAFEHNSLFSQNFSRVILDEGHYIRNWNSKLFKSITHIQSTFKWVVTATPIFNRIDDIYSYFRFLELESVDSRKSWQNLIHSEKGILTYRHLNQLVKKHSFKVEKANVLRNELQPKNEIDLKITLDSFEKDFYEALWQYSIQRIEKLSERAKNLKGLDLNTQTVRQVLTNNVLVYILRLKQSCNSPWLVINKMTRLSNSHSLQTATERLQYYTSSINTEEECPICYDNNADSIADPCGHKCCNSCWKKLLQLEINKCPKCRSHIHNINFVHEVQNTSPRSYAQIKSDFKDSSKIKTLVDIVKQKVQDSQKIVIVSQWVNMLDIVKDIVSEKLPLVKHISLQGNVPMKERHSHIQLFQNNSEYQICYISLMSSAEGINLTAANNMIILDTWWNQSKITQVTDRVHRIGQYKDVNIYKLSIDGNNSIEQRINSLVLKKERLKNLVINEWNIDNTKSYDDTWINSDIKLIN